MNDAEPYRLPRTAVPTHYRLALQPDLESASFEGSVDIELTVTEPLDRLVCNAAELEIDHAVLVDSDGDEIACAVDLDDELERANIVLARVVEPGPHQLSITYRGVLNDKLRGFYRSTFTDDDGAEHTIATTQMQATDARRAFPCWDEPDLKASFGITLIVDDDQLAIANTTEIGRERLDDGKVAVAFADTMVMSTYLVAFVVGPLVATEPVDVGGVPLRVIHRPGREHQTAFALETAAAALRFFEDYYGIAYPGDKVDLVAIPDFAFGAMENLGCVIFREVLLLAEPDEVTQAELQNVADVINHELAHMWFGDLVTMKWWNGIWLNEAFATFMEMKATDSFRPEWDRWANFGLSRSAAFDTDSLVATRPVEIEVAWPHEAEAMFDILTYEKGAALVRMLEQYLGEDAFREGIRHYLKRHAHANTETHDLWDALESVTDQPVRRLMNSWIHQGGYPVVALDRENAMITQRRFRADGASDDARWTVPVRLSTGTDEHRVLVEDDATPLPDNVDPDSIVSLNHRASGFYRVRLDDQVLARIGTHGPGDLDRVERYSLVDDTWALCIAGDVSATTFLELLTGFVDDHDTTVWQRISGSLAALGNFTSGGSRTNYQAHVRQLLSPAFERLGVEPSEGEPTSISKQRGIVFAALGISGADPAVRELARRIEPKSEVEPELAAAALRVIARTGSDTELDEFISRFRSATSPQVEQRYLSNLPSFPLAQQLDRVLDLTMTGDVRTQDIPFLLRNSLLHPDHGDRAWAFLTNHWDNLTDRLPTNTIVRLLDGTRGLDQPHLCDAVHSFLEEHPRPQGAKIITQILERQRILTDFRLRETPTLTAAFS